MVFLAEGDECFRRQVIVRNIRGRNLRDVVILTVEATEVTACAGQRKALCAWMEMVEWLLLDGGDGQGTGLAINLTKKYTTIISSTETASCLTIDDMAMVRTELTLHCPTLQLLIIPALFHLLRRSHIFHLSPFTFHLSPFT